MTERKLAVKFYELSEDGDLTGQWRLGKLSDETGKAVLLDGGRALRRKGALNAVIAEKGEPLDYCLTTYNIPVARAPLAAAVAAVAGSDLQRLPLAIAAHPGFEALNAVRVVSCLDEEKSQVEPMTERELAEQRRLGLRDTFRLLGDYCIHGASVPDDAHFFRPEGLEGVLIVSESVRDVIAATGAIGPRFTLVGQRASPKARPKVRSSRTTPATKRPTANVRTTASPRPAKTRVR
jgi:hypothetical protein